MKTRTNPRERTEGGASRPLEPRSTSREVTRGSAAPRAARATGRTLRQERSGRDGTASWMEALVGADWDRINAGWGEAGAGQQPEAA
jgi:hypothetical protein